MLTRMTYTIKIKAFKKWVGFFISMFICEHQYFYFVTFALQKLLAGSRWVYRNVSGVCWIFLLFKTVHTTARIKCNYSPLLSIFLLFWYYALSFFISRVICKEKSNWSDIIFYSFLICRGKIYILDNKSFHLLSAWSKIQVLPGWQM